MQRAGIMSWPRLVMLCVDACPVGGGPVSHCGVGGAREIAGPRLVLLCLGACACSNTNTHTNTNILVTQVKPATSC